MSAPKNQLCIAYSWLTLFASLCCLSVAGAQAQADDEYRLGARDVVTIKVLGAPELDGRFTVSEAGRINHPHLGEVGLGGLTRAAAERRLKELLEADLFQAGRANVTLEVDEVRSRPIHVIGAVEKATKLPSARRWTLLEAITEAGGLKPDRARKAHIIRRADNGLTAQIEIDLDDLFLRGDPAINLPLYPNDMVNVPQAVEVTIYCLGEVETPGPVTFRSSEQMSLVTAISRAGGLTDRAKWKILIQRRSTGNLMEEITANYKDILAGRTPDILLEPGDVIHVGQSLL